MGVRADMTPQVTRIDAHLLNRQACRGCAIAAACCTLPFTLTGTREPLQLGAELYGHAGIEADVEVLRLLADSVRLAECPLRAHRHRPRRLFPYARRARRAGAGREEELFDLLQAKDVPELRRMLADVSNRRKRCWHCPELYGGPEVLSQRPPHDRRRMPRSARSPNCATPADGWATCR